MCDWCSPWQAGSASGLQHVEGPGHHCKTRHNTWVPLNGRVCSKASCHAMCGIMAHVALRDGQAATRLQVVDLRLTVGVEVQARRESLSYLRRGHHGTQRQAIANALHTKPWFSGDATVVLRSSMPFAGACGS